MSTRLNRRMLLSSLAIREIRYICFEYNVFFDSSLLRCISVKSLYDLLISIVMKASIF